MFSAMLSVLLVCNRRTLRHCGKFSNMLIGPHVRHFSDRNQCVQRKKNNSLPSIVPKQRERCLYRVFKLILKVGVEESIVNAALVSLRSKNTNNAKSEVRFKLIRDL
jgi:hypothetical protein